MTQNSKMFDITGQICPYCLLLVKKELAKMNSGEVLFVKSDHPPAALDTIPYAMEKIGYPCDIKLCSPGLWELKITKK